MPNKLVTSSPSCKIRSKPLTPVLPRWDATPEAAAAAADTEVAVAIAVVVVAVVVSLLPTQHLSADPADGRPFGSILFETSRIARIRAYLSRGTPFGCSYFRTPRSPIDFSKGALYHWRLGVKEGSWGKDDRSVSFCSWRDRVGGSVHVFKGSFAHGVLREKENY